MFTVSKSEVPASTPRSTSILPAIVGSIALAGSMPALAGCGLFGIDHKVQFDDSGIWSRSNQRVVEAGTLLTVLGGALWEGSESRPGEALWRSADAMAIGAVSAEVMKVAFSRTRPSETDDPCMWFQGPGNKSFPSGEVMLVTTAVTPVILEYGAEHPAVWLLGLLPAYDAVARVKVHGHWQTDVLTSLALGAAIGTYTHDRDASLFVGVLPHGVTVGWKKSF